MDELKDHLSFERTIINDPTEAADSLIKQFFDFQEHVDKKFAEAPPNEENWAWADYAAVDYQIEEEEEYFSDLWSAYITPEVRADTIKILLEMGREDVVIQISRISDISGLIDAETMKSLGLTLPINPEIPLQETEDDPASDPSQEHLISLRRRESIRRLDQTKFYEQLSLDFQEQLQDNPPIEGTFSPEKELARMKSLPKEQKGEALANFRDNLARQRKAFATCRVFVERSIEFNHDVPREKLMELIEVFGENYGFTEEQKQLSRGLINRYYEQRQKALEVRQRFPDNTVLINELTGVEFENSDEFDVSVGPMTIDIETTGHNVETMLENAHHPVTGLTYGFASQSVGKNSDSVFYVVIRNDNMVMESDNPKIKALRNHEREHQKNKLFRAVFQKPYSPNKQFLLLDAYYVESHDENNKKEFLKEYLRTHREYALEKVKDEITATLYHKGEYYLKRDLEAMFFSKQAPYDYLTYARNDVLFKYDVLYQETAQKILVDEYRTIIEKAVDSYMDLVYKGHYSTQEAIALLTDKPLSDWPKTIRRLMEQQKETDQNSNLARHQFHSKNPRAFSN